MKNLIAAILLLFSFGLSARANCYVTYVAWLAFPTDQGSCYYPYSPSGGGDPTSSYCCASGLRLYSTLTDQFGCSITGSTNVVVSMGRGKKPTEYLKVTAHGVYTNINGGCAVQWNSNAGFAPTSAGVPYNGVQAFTDIYTQVPGGVFGAPGTGHSSVSDLVWCQIDTATGLPLRFLSGGEPVGC